MATLIVLSTPRDGGGHALGRYVERVMPMLITAGGQAVKRVGVRDVIAGRADVGFVIVMDFKDAATIRALFDSDEYQALIPLRDQGFAAMDIYITEDL